MAKILLVDDDVNLSNLYKELLTRDGHEVLAARDSNTAFTIATSEDIQFILLDYMLAADTTGMQFLEKLQGSDRKGKFPIVMLTNVVEDAEREKALQLGVNEYLSKAQLKPSEIVELIKKYLN